MNQIARVEPLGGKGELKFTEPAQKISDIACALKITSGNLQPVKVSAP